MDTQNMDHDTKVTSSNDPVSLKTGSYKYTTNKADPGPPAPFPQISPHHAQQPNPIRPPITTRIIPLIFHARLYAIAECYLIPSPKSYSQIQFTLELETCWNTASLYPAITAVYALTPGTDRGLRDVLVNRVAAGIQEYMPAKGWSFRSS